MHDASAPENIRVHAYLDGTRIRSRSSNTPTRIYVLKINIIIIIRRLHGTVRVQYYWLSSQLAYADFDWDKRHVTYV